MRFNLVVNLERMTPDVDMRDVARHLTEMVQMADEGVTAAPAAVYLDRWQGFSWREYAGDTTFRWLGPSGEWQLVNSGAAAIETRLELELWSLGAARDLELTLDGERVATVRIAPEPAWYSLGSLSLGSGRHRLGWRPVGPAVVADELLGNGDLRPLTVAVGSWRWQRVAGGDGP